MPREYLRVTPTSAGLDPDVVSTAIASLHKLSATDSDGVIARLTPFRSEQPVTFEFLTVSDGTNEPVEFYYGADTKLDVLQQRLRSIYPDSFDIDRVDIDIVRKLIQPVEQRPAEFDGGLEEERLLDPDAPDPPTDRNPPIGTDGGTVRARPSLEDVTPYGVRWRGSVDRRKDWMTSLTDFSDTITPTPNHADEENPHSGRAPLAPLIDQLTDATQPLAFQVVFQRKPDWSRQARRRSGALLAGKDTLLQKLTRQLRRPGLELGYLLDENRDPEDEPLRIPPALLPFHVGRFAKTGAGKSIALINDALSVYEQIPELLPGFAFFNIEPALANGVPRQQAIKDRVDHYVEVLKMTMGAERYEQAVVSPNLLKYLIRLMYDDEHGLDHGRYRESVDYFGQSQLEQIVDQLYAAGPPQAAPEEAPQSSSEEVTSKIHRHLMADPQTFANIMGGVSNRMDYITADPFLRQIFDTTEPRFDIRNLLDEDVVVIFDLGDLRADAATVMAGVILTNLYDAVTERGSAELAATPDDYVANLLIDEASSIVVSDVFNDLLEQGREFNLSVELVSQFPEQMELEGDREIYLNVLNNIGAPIVGKIAVDDEIARALAHEDMDPTEFRNRVRALPRGEWIAQVPSPEFGETGPMPFSIDPLPIPAGHPESEVPLTATEEARFGATLDTVHERTQADYSVPVDGNEPTARVPESLQAALELATDGLDELLAVLTRYVQLREGVRETNEPVSVRAVDDLLETWYDTQLPGSNSDANDEGDRDVPSREALAEIRDRSPLFELSVDTDRNETVMRLTETGERTSEPDTGTVQAAGTAAHDDAIGRVEAAFTRAGFLVAPVRQDGSAQPDAWAVHPEAEVPLALEVETTTHTKPAKVLTNLARAQEHGVVPVFVVPSGDDAESAIAQRVANILEEPVKTRKRGEVELYVGTDHVTFNGGAEADNGVTAVRPVASKTDTASNRTRWRREGGEYVLTDEDGTEHARVADVDAAPKEQFPATYSIDRDSGTVTVSVPGELPRTYESEAAFREDWVPVKRPVLPESDLPVAEYDPETYAIGVLRDGDRDTEKWDGDVAIYEDGGLHPVQGLTEALQTDELWSARSSPDDVRGSRQPTTVTADVGAREQGSAGKKGEPRSASTGEEDSSSPDGAAGGVESFASERLVEDEGNVIPFRDVYDAYESFVEANELEPKPDTHFTPALKEYIPVESQSKWFDGATRQCYIGVDLVDSGEQRGDTGV